MEKYKNLCYIKIKRTILEPLAAKPDHYGESSDQDTMRKLVHHIMIGQKNHLNTKERSL